MGANPKRADDRVDPKEDKRSVKSKMKVDEEEVVIGIEAIAPSGLVKPSMCATLVNWMATAHEEFELHQEMLHLSVYVLDCFLSLAGQKVTPKNFFFCIINIFKQKMNYFKFGLDKKNDVESVVSVIHFNF